MSIAENIVSAVKAKLTGLRPSPVKVRELSAALFLKINESRIVKNPDMSSYPGGIQFLDDLQELSQKAGLPVPEVYVMRMEISPGMLTRTKMIFPEAMLRCFLPEQIRAIIGHELGHVNNGDMDSLFHDRHNAEFKADAFAAEITGDPNSIIDLLEIVADSPRNLKETPRHPNPLERIKKLEEAFKVKQSGSFAARFASETQERQDRESTR